jgi:hypothetical protein
MSFFSFFGNGDKKATGVMLIDVGSGSVGGAVAVFEHGQKPKVVFTAQSQLPIETRITNKHILPAMVSSLENVIDDLTKKGVGLAHSSDGKSVSLSRIVLNFSSPWHVATTRTIHFKFEKKFLIHHSFLEDILSHEARNFLDSISKDEKDDEKFNHEKFLIAEQELSKIFINGYPVLNPLNKEAEEFELAVFFSALPNNVIKAVERHCGKNFPSIRPDFHTSAAVHAKVLRKIFPSEESFFIAHISGETTDISVIKKGVITEIASFPLGRNFIVRRLVEDIPGVTPAIALSMLKVNAEGNTNAKLSEKLRSTLEQAETDWVQLFAGAIQDFSKDFFLPAKVFVLAGDNSSKTFADIINENKLLVRGPETPKIMACPFDESFLSSSVIFPSGDNFDIFISALAVFSEKAYFPHLHDVD